MGAMAQVISVDDARTWPADVRTAVRELAERYEGVTEHTSDLAQEITLEEEAGFRRALRDRSVKVYHATRLLDYEMERIRLEGLQPASVTLAVSRIEAAQAAGFIDTEERAAILSGGFFARESLEHREGNVCFFSSRKVLDDVSPIWSLMTTWGGEIIYFDLRHDPRIGPRLKALGRPAIVVAGIDLSDTGPVRHAFPGVAAAFVGKRLGLHDPDMDIFHAGVAGEILDIWTPGDKDYDQHRNLPPVDPQREDYFD
jgi:hypothetical protein